MPCHACCKPQVLMKGEYVDPICAGLFLLQAIRAGEGPRVADRLLEAMEVGG